MPSKFRRERLDEGAAVGKRSAVQVHQPRDALGNPICRARNHDARVAVSQEHDLVEVLELDEVHHVGDVSVYVDVGRGEVRPLAEAGEGAYLSGIKK
jgi:hypothetical protein